MQPEGCCDGIMVVVNPSDPVARLPAQRGRGYWWLGVPSAWEQLQGLLARGKAVESAF